MKTVKDKAKMKNIHFIGVGGVSMSALAEHALRSGNIVSGSDILSSERVDRLKNLGC